MVPITAFKSCSNRGRWGPASGAVIVMVMACAMLCIPSATLDGAPEGVDLAT